MIVKILLIPSGRPYKRLLESSHGEGKLISTYVVKHQLNLHDQGIGRGGSKIIGIPRGAFWTPEGKLSSSLPNPRKISLAIVHEKPQAINAGIN